MTSPNHGTAIECCFKERLLNHLLKTIAKRPQLCKRLLLTPSLRATHSFTHTEAVSLFPENANISEANGEPCYIPSNERLSSPKSEHLCLITSTSESPPASDST